MGDKPVPWPRRVERIDGATVYTWGSVRSERIKGEPMERMYEVRFRSLPHIVARFRWLWRLPLGNFDSVWPWIVLGMRMERRHGLLAMVEQANEKRRRTHLSIVRDED